MQSVATSATSSAFIWRRVHSLMGFWLVVYLVIHLLTNSQAALLFGNEGSGFVRLVNLLERLPYLHAIEILLIGIPLGVHTVWGIYRALTARMNVHSNKTSPALSYERNQAFSLQRITSWILLFGIIGHVVQMRFLEMPKQAIRDTQEEAMVKLTFDEGLYPLTQRFGVTLYNSEEIQELQESRCVKNCSPTQGQPFDPVQARTEEMDLWIAKLSSYSLRPNEVIAVAPNPGVAMLLMVRNTFKSPWMVGFYTLFVLAAAFHACNGFWTFLITWGVILSYRSQKTMIPVCFMGAVGLALLGLAAIWGSYWL
jgi:succinate dehydrogenase / fumarate reductase, cytochrome b subunit